MCSIGVLCDGVYVGLSCVVDYEDVAYVSCVEDDAFCI